MKTLTKFWIFLEIWAVACLTMVEYGGIFHTIITIACMVIGMILFWLDVRKKGDSDDR